MPEDYSQSKPSQDSRQNHETMAQVHDIEARKVEFDQAKLLFKWCAGIISTLIVLGIANYTRESNEQTETLQKLVIAQDATKGELTAIRLESRDTQEKVLKMWYGGGWDGRAPTKPLTP